MSEEVYYKIGRFGDEIVVCCLQDFDEPDYDTSRWISDKKYATEEEAEEIAALLRLKPQPPIIVTREQFKALVGMFLNGLVIDD